MASTRLGYLAIQKETTAGTAVQPSNFIRFKDGDIMFSQEVIENNPIQNNRALPITAVDGKAQAQATYNIDLDYEEAGYWLYGALGTVSTSTTNGVTTHTITVANSLPTFTIEQMRGDSSGADHEVVRAFGAKINSVTINGADGIINMAVNVIALDALHRRLLTSDAAAGSTVAIELESVEGLTTDDTVSITDDSSTEDDPINSISTANKTVTIVTLGNSYTVADNAKVELKAQTPSYSNSQNVFSFHHAKFQFGANLTAAGSATEDNIEDWEFTHENGLEERYGSVRAGPSTVAEKGYVSRLSYTKFFTSKAERDRYLATIRRACIITMEKNETIGSGNANPQVIIKLNDLKITSWELPTGTDEVYAERIQATAFYNGSDGQALNVEIASTTSDYTA